MGSPANIDANRDEVLTACGCAYSDVGELARRVAARQPPSEPSNALQPEAPLDWWDLVTEDDYACNFSHFLAHCATLSKDYNLTQINSGLWFNVAKHSQREWVAGIASTGADPYDYSIVDFIGRTENATAHLSAALEAAGAHMRQALPACALACAWVNGTRLIQLTLTSPLARWQATARQPPTHVPPAWCTTRMAPRTARTSNTVRFPRRSN